jgi:hypothetical protein
VDTESEASKAVCGESSEKESATNILSRRGSISKKKNVIYLSSCMGKANLDFHHTTTKERVPDRSLLQSSTLGERKLQHSFRIIVIIFNIAFPGSVD